MKIAANDDWNGFHQMMNVFSDVGAFSLLSGSKDAVLLVTLTPGVYALHVSGIGGTTGVPQVEIYDVP